MTRDPLGGIDGTNLYSYVRNNPILLLDPLGLYASVCVDDDGNVEIVIPIEFSGDFTDELIADIIGCIESKWSGTFGEYNVTTRVVKPKGKQTKNKIRIDKPKRRARTGYYGGIWDPKSTCEVHAHETGHLLGIDDGYVKEDAENGVLNPQPGRSRDDLMVSIEKGNRPFPNAIEDAIDKNKCDPKADAW